jgi:hypothetical protein
VGIAAGGDEFEAAGRNGGGSGNAHASLELGNAGWALRARARVASLRSAKSSRTHAGVTWVATWTGCTLEWQRLESPPMPPTFANGKICYIEMPATDIDRSSNFYKQVFGWNTEARRRQYIF